MRSDIHHVQFFSEDVNFDLSDRSVEIQNWILDTATAENHSIGHINVICCSDEYLLALNIKHLNKNYYTDIITFEYDKDPVEGDLYISIDRIKENALGLNIEFEEELNRVIIHGLLHLMGYRDDTPDSKNEIRQKENYYLNLLTSSKPN